MFRTLVGLIVLVALAGFGWWVAHPTTSKRTSTSSTSASGPTTTTTVIPSTFTVPPTALIATLHGPA
ncbi:MAG TPA: hypothetical protein VNV87_14700, partial [Acidimicrobiales bacterium]|nr:hypothetical protein [Acidimicrobiales bacterium]